MLAAALLGALDEQASRQHLVERTEAKWLGQARHTAQLREAGGLPQHGGSDQQRLGIGRQLGDPRAYHCAHGRRH